MSDVKITPKEIAVALHGSEYGRHFPLRDIVDAAKTAGIVIVYGASDDLMEFEGAITDEVGAYDGTTALVDEHGPIGSFEAVEHEEAECAAWFARKFKAKPIKAIWNDRGDGPAWTFETDIPHESFDVMEDGEVFCRGIVFHVDALRADLRAQEGAA